MTEILYFGDIENCYSREFDARIVGRGPDHVVLDRTLFYAEGGGQPSDRGTLRWEGGETAVTRVKKEKGVVRHYVETVPGADAAQGAIDWDLRYAHMRMHTSQHLLSGLAYKIFAARTVGNQIHPDRSRIDFQPADFAEDDLRRLEAEANRVIADGQPVQALEEDRALVENRVEDRALMDLIPRSIKRLRVIRIGTADYCPCGGTHLRNVREIGEVRILGKRSKGKETDRVEYELRSD